jgi:hypothetical protein
MSTYRWTPSHSPSTFNGTVNDYNRSDTIQFDIRAGYQIVVSGTLIGWGEHNWNFPNGEWPSGVLFNLTPFEVSGSYTWHISWEQEEGDPSQAEYRDVFWGNYVPKVTVAAGVSMLGKGRAIQISNFATAVDIDGPSDQPTKIRLSLSNPLAGNFFYNGSVIPNGSSISYQEFLGATFKAAGKDGLTTAVTITAVDEQSASASGSFTIKLIDYAPQVTVHSQTELTSEVVEPLSGLVSVTPGNPDDDPDTYVYRLTDTFTPTIPSNFGDGGFFTYDGVTAADVVGQDLTAQEFNDLKYEDAGIAGTDTLGVTVSDGEKWSALKTFTVVAHNRPPVVTSNGDVTATFGTPLNVSDLFSIDDDPDGPHDLAFTIQDLTTGPGAGTLRLNGVAQLPGLPISILSEDKLSLITYTAGTSKTPDKIQLTANDGLDKSKAVVTITNAPLPDVSVSDLYTEMLTFAAAAYPANDGDAGQEFDALMQRWRPLTASDLGFEPSATNDTFVSAGRFQNDNAEAIVAAGNMTLGSGGTATPTLVVAYRGTDLAAGIPETVSDLLDEPSPILQTLLHPLTPGFDPYWAKLADLQTALMQYITQQGIKRILLTGHSLGGAAAQTAVAAFRAALPGIDVEAATDGSPGNNAGSAGQPLVMFQNSADPIPLLGSLGLDVKGGKIVELTYAENRSITLDMHSKFLYTEIVAHITAFLAAHPKEPNFLSTTPAQAAAGPTWVVVGGTSASWQSSSAAAPLHDVIGYGVNRRNSELLIGTLGPDVIVGSGGKDHLYGNGGGDTFVLMDGSPTAFANPGVDTFDLVLGTDATIDETAGSSGQTDIVTLCSSVSLNPAGTFEYLASDLRSTLAAIDPSTLFYRKDNSDLVLSCTFGGKTTNLRIDNLGAVGGQDERLSFNAKAGSTAPTPESIDLLSLWALAAATPQVVPLPSGNSGADTTKAKIQVASISGFASKLTVLGAPNQQLDTTTPVTISETSLTLDSANPPGMVLDHGSNNLGLSSNGRYVLFSDRISGAYANWPNEAIFSRDLATGTVSVLTTNQSGTPLSISTDDNNGLQGDISEDGRFLAFRANPSDAGYPTKWIAGYFAQQGKPPQPNYVYFDQILVKDLQSGTITPVTVDTSGNEIQADFVSLDAFAASGRYVAFEATLQNPNGYPIPPPSATLVAGTNDLSPHVYIRDISEGTTALAPQLTAAGNFSADGHYLIGQGVVAGVAAVLVDDLWNNGVKAVSANQGGVEANAAATNGLLSADAETAVFESAATNLVVGVTDGETHIYSKDLLSGSVTEVDAGLAGNADHPAMSGDGRFVTFFEQTGQLPLGPGGFSYALYDLYVADLATGKLADIGPIGTERFSDTVSRGNITSSLSSDGTTIAVDFAPSYDPQYGNSAAVNEYTISNPLYTSTVKWRPQVVVTDQQITAGYTVSAASLFAATDRSGDELITGFTITDATGNGYFSLAGVREASTFQFTIGQLGQLTYTAGTAGTIDTVNVQATDGSSVSLSASFQAAAVPITVPELRDETLAPDLQDADGNSERSGFSQDGRLLVFASQADNLAPGDSNAVQDIFVRDLQSGTTRRINLATDRAQADDLSASPVISANGGAVAFESWATNLVADDTDSVRDVFVWSADTGKVQQVSSGLAGATPDGDSYAPSLSSNGSIVAFASTATDLAAGDTNVASDVFVRQLASGATVRASTASDGSQADDVSWFPLLTGDGARVFFDSYADNLVTGDTNQASDIFEKILSSGATVRVSTTASNGQADNTSYLRDTTPDGRYVLFDSWADNLVNGDANGTSDVFVKDLTSGKLTLVSQSSSGEQGNGASRAGWISDDGRFVVFQSQATSFGPDDAAGVTHVYVKDLVTGKLREVSRTIVGASLTSDATVSGLSGDGRFIAFTSSQAGATFDKTGSQNDVFTIPNPLYYLAPTVSASSLVVPRSTTLASAGLFSVTPGAAGTVTEVQVYESPGDPAQGTFTLNGSSLKIGQYDLLQASDVAHLSFTAGSATDHAIHDSLAVRGYDGETWGAWTNFSVTTEYYGPPTVTVQNITLQQGFTESAPEFVAVIDSFGRPVQDVQFEQTPGFQTGLMLFDGQVVTPGTSLDVTPDQLSEVTFRAARATTQSIVDTLQVRATDGQTWSDWSPLTITATPGNTPPLLSVDDTTLQRGQSISFASVVHADDLNGDLIVDYEIESTNGDPSHGSLAESGTTVALGLDTSGQAIVADIPLRMVGGLAFVSGSSGTSATFMIRASDGTDWSAWKAITLTTSTVDSPTIVTILSQSVQQGTQISAGQLFSTADLNGDSLQKIEVKADGGAAGVWTLDGAPASLTDGTLVVAAADLPRLAYRAPSLVGSSPNLTDTIEVRAYDGFMWGSWNSGAVTALSGNTAPSLSTSNLSLGAGQTVTAQAAVQGVDPNGDPITAYEVHGPSLGADASQWVLSGTPILDQQLTPDQFAALSLLAATQPVGGASQNTLSVRAFDGKDWSPWANVDVTTTQGMLDPTVAVNSVTLAPGGSRNLADFITANDPSGDALTSFQVYDPDQTAASATLLADGVAVTASDAVNPLSVSNLSQLTVTAGASTRADAFFLRAYNGAAWSAWTQVTVDTAALPAAPVVDVATYLSTRTALDAAGRGFVVADTADMVSSHLDRLDDPWSNAIRVTDNGNVTVTGAQADSAIINKLVNADGSPVQLAVRSEILWQNANGQAAIWQMDGTTLTSSALLGANPGPYWRDVGTSDFNADAHPDLLLQNTNGAVVIWETNGTSVTMSALVANPGTSWKAVGTGDFSDDGHSDILLQNTNGAVAIWNMNGTDLTSSAAVANPGPSWKVVGTGDFDGDGHSDILLQNTNGNVAIWEMNGTDIKSSTAVTNPGASWKVIGTGDFNDDNHSDILLQNTNGNVAVWEMNGTDLMSSAAVANPGANWHAIGTNGGSHIFLQNTSGQTAIWDMIETNLTGAGAVSVNAGPSWRAVGLV